MNRTTVALIFAAGLAAGVITMNVIDGTAQAAPFNRTELGRADLGRIDQFCFLRSRFEDGGTQQVTVSGVYQEPVEASLPDGGVEAFFRSNDMSAVVVGATRTTLTGLADGALLVGARRILNREQ